jgi:hypothetical protein
MSSLTLAVSASVERNLAQLTERIESQLGSVAETVSQRAAEAADIAVASTFENTLERLQASIASLDEMGVSLVETVVQSRSQTEERMAEHVDEGLGALAKMIRSDNRVIAQRMSGAPSDTDAATAKQVLRAVKELQPESAPMWSARRTAASRPCRTAPQNGRLPRP